MLSADPAPGGMFRRWPFFQRLLSWTKPYAPVERRPRPTSATTGTACSATSRTTGRSCRTLMDGTSYFPSRPEMEATSRRSRSAHRPERPLRLPLDRRRGARNQLAGDASCSRRSDGEYRAGASSSLSASPSRHRRRRQGSSTPPTTPTRGPPRRTPTSASSSSASRTRASSWPSGLLPWARRIVARLAVAGEAVGQHPLAGRGPGALRAAVRGSRPWRRRRDPRRGDPGDRAGTRMAPLDVRLRAPEAGGDEVAFEVDEVIAATGFITPLAGPPGAWRRDVRRRTGCRPRPRTGRARTVPGIFFAGTIGAGRRRG